MNENNRMDIPFSDYGGSGKPLHFLHANGYPPACYDPLLKLLTNLYQVFGMLLRPMWTGSNPHDIIDWKPLSGDLLKFLGEKESTRVIGVGHSIGAVVTLRAALKEPTRFQALVLIEPVLFPAKDILQWYMFRALGLGHRLNAKIEGALKRRRSFDDLDQVFSGYRRKAIFRFFSDENLRSYIKGLVEPSETFNKKRASKGKYELAYPPEWEARIYYTGLWNDWDLWSGIPRLDIPTLILRGSETDTFNESTARSVGKRNPKIRIITIDQSTHLVPLEKPQEVFDLTQSFLDNVV